MRGGSKELGEQILEARTTLVEHYQKYGENAKMEEALDQTVQSFWKVLKSDVKKTPSFLEAAMDVAEQHLKAGRSDAADMMFLKIESDAADTFGEDDDNTIRILTHIGMFYQRTRPMA